MEELVPLTISSSVSKNPTVLFTQSRERYLLYEPFDGSNHINCELFALIFNHFKVETLKKGYFSYRGKKYLCSEDVSGIIQLDEWLSFQWSTKRQFSRFIRPRALFDMYLTDLFFPVFDTSSKWIVPGVKDKFVVHPFPHIKKEGLVFKPIPLNNTGLSSPSMKLFFKHMKSDLSIFLEDFMQLYHDKFRAELKYRISLYPEKRNLYWEELQLCFDPAFKKYVRSSVENYILQL